MSEWYCCRVDYPARYICDIELVKTVKTSANGDNKVRIFKKILDSKFFSRVLENSDEQNKWFKVCTL